jgi:DNA-binding CsgD family transcriptional regulator
MKPLTRTQVRVAELLGDGYARWKIAELLGLNERTVKDHIKTLCERYKCPPSDVAANVKNETTAKETP